MIGSVIYFFIFIFNQRTFSNYFKQIEMIFNRYSQRDMTCYGRQIKSCISATKLSFKFGLVFEDLIVLCSKLKVCFP